jgi:hypothetical protein
MYLRWGAAPDAVQFLEELQLLFAARGWHFRRQVRFCRYRFCRTGELKYRGAVGLGYRSTY